jgi:hypothetical protein
MEKLSGEKIAAVLTEVPGVLRGLAEERDSWRDRAVVAEQELTKRAQDDRITKIARIMEEKGLDSRPMADRIQALTKKASEGRLDAVEEAIGMVPKGINLGELVDVPRHSGASSDFVRFLMDDI